MLVCKYEKCKMHTKLIILRCILVLSCMFSACGGSWMTSVRSEKDRSGFRQNRLSDEWSPQNVSQETGRGFFPHGGIFSLGKVLNFFPVGGERECQPSRYTLARAGICLNPYDCRQRDGKAAGDCAHGLGVCCVFEVTCGATISNNVSYFMSPEFPALVPGDQGGYCNVTVHRAHAGIVQLRVDMVHFTLGQPNRTTGECDEDAMILGDDGNQFVVCGQNHGQHLYYTFSNDLQSRDVDELPSAEGTRLSIRMRGVDMPRIWLIRLVQLPLANSAPHDCLQYHTENNGTIRTFNYAVNGRHLASHEYRVCVRRNTNRCSVRYSPCDRNAFRIGQGVTPYYNDPGGPGGLGGPGTGLYGPDASFVPPPPAVDPMDQTVNETMQMPVVQNDEMMDVGSGEGSMSEMDSEPAPAQPQASQSSQAGATGQPVPEQPGIMTRIWRLIWPWSSNRSFSQRTYRWSPYTPHYHKLQSDKFRYQGYGNFGEGLQGYGRQRCRDRLTIQCDNEYFVASSYYGAGVCDPHHCGSSFCPGFDAQRCSVETSITPFTVAVHFGPPTYKRDPEENIGACLRYTQVLCDN